MKTEVRYYLHKFLFTCALILIPTVAHAGYDADVVRAWVSPNPVAAGESVTLSMTVQNLTTPDTEFGGAATFTFVFEIDIPWRFRDDECTVVRELRRDERRTITCSYVTRIDYPGTHDVDAHVKNLSALWTYDTYSFTFEATEDPCVGVTCPNRCDGNVRLWNGRCVGGSCVYERTDCDTMDTTGSRVSYCDGDDVRSRVPVSDFSCSSGTCVRRDSTTGDRYERTCSDTCDGATHLWRTCSGGSCTTEERTDCNVMDNVGDPVTYCRDSELWTHRWVTDWSCSSGTCNNVSEGWRDDYGLSTCAWGCTGGACNPSPCAGVTCPDTCRVGQIARTNGRPTVEGSSCHCLYDEQPCDDLDNFGPPQAYCDGDDVRTRQRFYDYTCLAGRCQTSESWVNNTFVRTCNDRCSGSISIWGQRCVDGACAGGSNSDCNAMDTPVATVPYCTSDRYLRAYDMHADWSCDVATGRCESREVQERDRTIEDCAGRVRTRTVQETSCDASGQPTARVTIGTWGCREAACAVTSLTERVESLARCDASERCEAGACVPCVSEWTCNDWTVCRGEPYRTRHCDDRYNCTITTRPAEREDCPCYVTSIEWTNASGGRLREAIDGDEVMITVHHEGHCAGIATRLEIWDDAWGPLRDTFVRDALFEFPNDVSPSQELWRVVFDYREDRGWGHYHYEVRLPSFDEESGTLDVGPYREEGGEAITFLTAHPPEPYSVSDALCLQGAHVTITDRCRELWERAGLIAEIEAEEQLSDVLGFFLGVTTGEIIYNAACTLCAFGIGPAGVVCVVPDGFEAIECPIAGALAVCDATVCLGFLGRYVSRAAGTLWRRILELRATRAIEPFLRSGFRTIAEGELRDDTAHFVLQNADYETIDVIARIDPRDPRHIVVNRIINHIKRYSGGDELLTFNEAWSRSNGQPLFWWSQNIRPGPGREIELMTSLFQDGFLQNRLHPLIADLTRGRYTVNDLIAQVQLKETVIGRSGSEVFGLTSSGTSTHRMFVEVNLGKLGERFEGRARSTTVHYLFPHEFSHAAIMRHLLDRGHTLASTSDDVGQALYYATEYLNDVHVLVNLREPYRGEFYDSMRLGLRGLTEAAGSEEIQRRISTSLSALAAGGTLEFLGAYAIVEPLARSRKLGMVAEERTIRRAIDDGLARYPADVRDRMRTAIDRLTTNLVADGDRYAVHVLDDRYDDTMLDILCTRYRIIACTGRESAPVVTPAEDPSNADVVPLVRDGGLVPPFEEVPPSTSVVDVADASGTAHHLNDTSDASTVAFCYVLNGFCSSDDGGHYSAGCRPLELGVCEAPGKQVFTTSEECHVALEAFRATCHDHKNVAPTDDCNCGTSGHQDTTFWSVFFLFLAGWYWRSRR